MLNKQAKLISPQQAKALLLFLGQSRQPVRNQLAFLLSLRAGLRAKEIASLTWAMVTDAEGEVTGEIRLENSAAKGNSGGIIPMSKDLREAFANHRSAVRPASGDERVIQTQRSKAVSAQVIVNLFADWFQAMGFEGASSHSGRRTFITNAARKITLAGGSMRDVQALARHSSLATTQRYIEVSSDAQRRVVDMI
jgi:integrase/recombinase XerD